MRELAPGPGEPSFLGAISHSPKRQMLSALPGAAFLLFLLMAWAVGDPTTPSFGQICGDLVEMLGERRPTTGWCSHKGVAGFPIQRDLLVCLAILSLGVVPVVINLQWQAYESLLGSLQRSHALVVPEAKSLKIDQLVERTNARIARIGKLAPMIAIATAVVVAAVELSLRSQGIYGRVSTDGGISTSHFNSWWAQFSSESAFGALGLFVIVAFSLYLVTIQNIVGAVLMSGLRNIRRQVTWGADPMNRDGYFGWATVRSALMATHWELALHGIAIACVLLALAPASRGPAMVVLVGQWFLSLPAHLLYPYWFARSSIRKYKAREIAKAYAIIEQPETPDVASTLVLQEAAQARIIRLKSIRTLPLGPGGDRVKFWLGLAADSIAVATIVVLFYSR